MPCEEDICGRLNFSMYGTRDAALNWHHYYRDHLVKLGFQQGRASPCLFFRPEKEIRVFVHGDDYVSLGQGSELIWLKGAMEKAYECKTNIIGPTDQDEKAVKVLNRSTHMALTWDHLRSRPEHAEIIANDL